ncbi:DNA polymerase I [Sulfitobacter sp. M57]|uniref:DNA polymerase I n=1 Tax=unclassified Sulfitobacter TaxID=196795 RepID=UPI0023E34554|nr:MULTISPECIES: DNA polymerase I [unclassified Sulfitobacter]MDF3415268.1 DNA polymerase I [Sulfitobacter sp. KE5]MDF3422749.1 DNA polymerase I [Sulfitobacter sp. KE43]MDF3433814.1 DNA polymerase I [Sulfitobacter sp. KE42]MDF3459454.1 DNA polymerase I [Sulfitobacter sp. S74]MDF3463353.1 DNA polymerase I [Sulfitobacter sp. Ks18]
MRMTFGKGHHLHLIDGSAFIFRAYHALPPLTRKSDGLPIGAVAGFCNMLHRYVEGNTGPDAPTHVAVIFDKGSHTFRNDMYDLYKANREAMPEDLRPQIPLTRTATEAFNIACEEKEGYEADDIIATLAVQARAAGGRCTIISSDKDLMQLVGDGVEMLDAMKNNRIDREGVFAKFGVYPEHVVDVQALAGDSVDNVPGAPGIGIKTAALLINEYGDLDALLERAGEIKQPKRRQTLIDNEEQIRLSRRLVQLDENTPLDFTIDDLEVRDPDPDTLLAFLAEMEFRTLTKRIADQMGKDAPAINDTAPAPQAPVLDDVPFDASTYEQVGDATALQKWIDAIYEVGHVAVDTETTGLNEMTAELVGISLATAPGKACYIPLIHKAGASDDLFGSDDLAEGQMKVEEALRMLTPMLEDPTILKIGQNMKYDAKIFAQIGITVAPFDDTMLLSYAQHAGLHNHGMDTLCERYLNHTPIPIKPLLGTGKSAITFDKVPLDKAVAYAAEDADITLRLWQVLKPQLHSAQVTKVYETLERPLVPVLADMERSGIKVDRDTLSRMSNAFAQKMAALEDEIYEIAGRKFNVGSPKQLGEILFDEMGIEGGKKGKTGAYATGVDILEDLATEHELPARVLDWRQLSKLKSTYTDALQTHINADTGRVHTSYSIAGASTGRLASTDPNLQNIPIRSEEGRRIREAFIAEPGKALVALDYSQIELRILAHIADIPALKEAFARGDDIHAMTASEMFDLPMQDMTPDIRRRAKAINFGVIYGISGFGLARNLRIPRSEAQGFIDRYFERFPGIRTYMDNTKAFAKEHGFVQTLFGRKIHTPNITAKGPHAGFAARAAINAPIQGTAADVIRRAMIRMPAAIKDLPATMLLQVHDELLFEVEQGHEAALIEAARDIMENANDPIVKLDVKLTVDAGQGANWAEAH